MTVNKPDTALDDPAELDRFLSAYRPTDLDAATWLAVADQATALVREAGELKRLRVEKDIQALGAVVAHLVERGRPTTITEALTDTTLLSYDTQLQALGASKRTRENKRGILRRLQAVHRGLPWREQRRTDGERVADMVQPAAARHLQQLLAEAVKAETAHGAGASEFVAAVAHARSERSGQVPSSTTFDWTLAREYAERHGLRLTKPILRSIVTHEVLDQATPVVLVASRYGLTRRDLDLALTRLPGLGTTPSPAHHALLRGAPGPRA